MPSGYALDCNTPHRRKEFAADLIDTVVYGGLAHANPEKAAIFESWEQSGIMGLIWAEFFAYLRGFMDTLKYFRLLNSHVIGMADPPPAKK
jgi:hypothetical protein